MGTFHYAIFATPIGACGIAWSARGIRGVELPEASVGATKARLLRRFPGAEKATADGAIRQAIDMIVALLEGAPVDLRGIELDDAAVPPFHRRVYEVAREIGPGSTLTYGDIAARLGEPDARAVGQALGRNPFAIVVPCHRVLAAGGRIGGFSAGGGAATKRRILAIERARAGDMPDLFADEPSSLRADCAPLR